MNNFEVLDKMCERNDKSIKMFPKCNIKSMRTGKDGFGSVTVAIDNESIHNLLNGSNHNLAVLVYDLSVMQEIKNAEPNHIADSRKMVDQSGDATDMVDVTN